ncbi:MAG: hypothetical protein HY906_10855 [Deltaproteobacteria bacterium]|nr:hypothetical protein [Deltaproteobacteria bacterium]
MAPTPPRFRDALLVLARHDVEFIVVGGVAAVLQGAPIATFDLDVVHRRTPENIARALAALAAMHARYRDLTGRVLTPTATALATPGHQLLLTDHGPLDVLGAIGNGLGYDDLVGDSTTMDVGQLQLRVLDLATVIALKEQLGRDKDRAALAVLRQTLALRRGGSQ